MSAGERSVGEATAERADVQRRLAAVREEMADAARAAGRDPGGVRVLLATKTVPAALVRAALEAPVPAGLAPVVVGENRVQELVAKGPELADLSPELHLIGHLQSNKVNHALRWASCIQSIDSLRIAQRISQRTERDGRVLDVLVQVNVSGEDSKYGVAPADAPALATEVAALPGLRLGGFMTIGPNPNTADAAAIRAAYARLRGVRDEVVTSGAPGTAGARELSMGMSNDFPLAVAEGATIVRLGSAVFGARPEP